MAWTAAAVAVDDETMGRKLHYARTCIERALKQALKREAQQRAKKTEKGGPCHPSLLDQTGILSRLILRTRLKKDKKLKREVRTRLADRVDLVHAQFGVEEERVLNRVTSTAAFNRAVDAALDVIRRRVGGKAEPGGKARKRLKSGQQKGTVEGVSDAGQRAEEEQSGSRAVVPESPKSTLMAPERAAQMTRKAERVETNLHPSRPLPKLPALPALTTGFTRGAVSDSDDGSIEDYDSDSAAPAKKNRRGQRARRAIWEKKFGKGARHVVEKKKELEKQRLERAHLRSAGGTSGNQVPLGSHRGQATPPDPTATLIETPAPLTKKPPKPKEDHPSWKAAQARKAKESASSEWVKRSLVEAPRLNKKIVFE